MRLIALLVVVVAAVAVGSGVFAPEPGAARLAGVSVSVAGFTITDRAEGRHRLVLDLEVASGRDLDECLAFSLDQPFAGRRFNPTDPSAGCIRPRLGAIQASIAFNELTDDDLLFPSHTLVWGIPGGRCSLLFQAFGVCVVDMAGTASVELPSHSVLPSTFPIGSFPPLFSYDPILP